MLPYLLHASTIWLAALLLYELLLRRESFHRYNRLYLLLSLATGLLLPMLHLSPLFNNQGHALLPPVQQIHRFQQSLLPAQPTGLTTPAPTHSTASLLLWLLYGAGVAAGFFLLLREVRKLRTLYSSGNRYREQGYLLVETGQDHCPFSFFRIIFVNSRRHYTPDQWRMLLAHEQEHGRRLHSMDNLALILLRIIFWFHPLPHLYYKRLRMLHEFEADEAAAFNTFEYGSFLLEQTLLQRVPALAHPIHHSPIKTRIAMLTGTKSTRSRLLKYLGTVPLLLAFLLFCTAGAGTGNTGVTNRVTSFRGNEIVFGPLKVIPASYREKIEQQKKMFLNASLPDSVPEKHWTTGELRMVPVHADTMPVAINGRPILGNEPQYLLPDADTHYTVPVAPGAPSLDAYLFSQLKEELDRLEDGQYELRLYRLVIDGQGHVAYYEYEGLVPAMGTHQHQPHIAAGISMALDRKLAAALAPSVRFVPARKEGQPVNVRMSLGNYLIVVQGHRARLEERTGC